MEEQETVVEDAILHILAAAPDKNLSGPLVISLLLIKISCSTAISALKIY